MSVAGVRVMELALSTWLCRCAGQLYGACGRYTAVADLTTAERSRTERGSAAADNGKRRVTTPRCSDADLTPLSC